MRAWFENKEGHPEHAPVSECLRGYYYLLASYDDLMDEIKSCSSWFEILNLRESVCPLWRYLVRLPLFYAVLLPKRST